MEIYVYGTGCGAGELLRQGLALEDVRGFVDSFPSGESFLGKPVISPAALAGRPYDLVVVTSRQSEAIAETCRAAGIDGGKLLFLKNHFELQDRNERAYALAEGVLSSEALGALRASQHIVPDPLWQGGETLSPRDLENDFVRVKTLETLCRALAGVPGAAAELGVYKGGFARCINALLPERTLWLFDTFAGFDEAEAAREMAENGVGEAFVAAHRNTAVERVLSLMPHPAMVHPVPGLFPASLEGLEERFALVSLDVDLEESTLEGLRYFVPRMEPGGYLMLHDYNSPLLPGVKNAVARFEQEWGRRLRGVPLCDVNGTLVVAF